jgi:hypothetical protein
VTIRLDLSGEDLLCFANLSPGAIASTAASLSLGDRVQGLQELVAQLSPLALRQGADPSADNLGQCAKVIQSFFKRGKLEDMLLIYRLLQALSPAFAIQVNSNFYQDPLRHAQKLSLRFPSPMSLDLEAKQMKSRYRAVGEIEEEIRLGLAALEHDPLLRTFDPEGFSSLRRQFIEAYALVEGLISLTGFSPEQSALFAQRQQQEKLFVDRLSEETQRLLFQYRQAPLEGPHREQDLLPGYRRIQRQLQQLRQTIETVSQYLRPEEKSLFCHRWENDQAALQELLDSFHLSSEERQASPRSFFRRPWRPW